MAEAETRGNAIETKSAAVIAAVIGVVRLDWRPRTTSPYC
jgi:hypothetical protein